MELNWNLDKIYLSFESEELIKDKLYLKELLKKSIEEFREDFKNINSEVLAKFIKRNSEIITLFEKLFSFGQLSFSSNVKNEKALELIEYCEELLILDKELDVLFKEALRNYDLELSDNTYLKEHEFYLNEQKETASTLLDQKEELLMEQMKNIGCRAWEKLQDTLTSTLQVKYTDDRNNEKLLPLSEIRNMAYSNDAKIRKNAYEAELASYKNIELSVGAALNNIKAQSIKESQMRGYKNVLDITLSKSRMDEETLNAMLSVIKDNLPKFASYFKRKAKILGHKEGLPFYDLFAPIGEAHMNFTIDEARKFILENFYSFSQSLGQMAEKAFDEKWIDFLPKDGKVGGAFCYNLHHLGESRILTNFTGSLSDVLTLAHELGHAYHGYTLKNESILNSSYTMPIAETASIFCESIVKNAALGKADKASKITILEQDISDSMQVVVDIYSRYLFESRIIKEREEKSISIEKLKEYMLESQKEAYLDGLDHNQLHEYMWLCKGHYYSAELNFYNFPYAFGLLFSKGLYARYLNEGDTFIEKYDKLLSITGKNSIEDIGKFMDIDLHKREFWQNSIDLILKDIESFLELSEDL